MVVYVEIWLFLLPLTQHTTPCIVQVDVCVRLSLMMFRGRLGKICCGISVRGQGDG